jgi:uncharacterized membrane protein (UPF0127 family)
MKRLVKTKTKEILVENLLVRTTFWGRFKGLLVYKKLPPGTAMLLVSTKRVHTFFVLFPLDLYYFDASLCLLSFQFCVTPWRKPRAPKGTKHVLEIHHLQNQQPLDLETGEQVSIRWNLYP